MRPPRSLPFQSLLKRPPIKHPNRHFSTPSPPQPPRQPPKDPRSRLRDLNSRLPQFLRCYTTPLLDAPVAHATSFLILHELTAVIPLFGLVAAFHYGNWMPGFGGSVFDDAVRRFGRWLRRRGWIDGNGHGDGEVDYGGGSGGVGTGIGSGNEGAQEVKGTRLVLEFASAYVVTKALLPVRIAASVWATPWFARTVFGPASKCVRRLLRGDTAV